MWCGGLAVTPGVNLPGGDAGEPGKAGLATVGLGQQNRKPRL